MILLDPSANGLLHKILSTAYSIDLNERVVVTNKTFKNHSTRALVPVFSTPSTLVIFVVVSILRTTTLDNYNIRPIWNFALRKNVNYFYP